MKTALDTIHVDEHLRSQFTTAMQEREYTDPPSGRTYETVLIKRGFDAVQVNDYIHSVWGTQRLYYTLGEDGLPEVHQRVVLTNPVAVTKVEPVGVDYRLYLKVGTDHRRSKSTTWSDAVVMLGQVSKKSAAEAWMASNNMKPSEALAFMDYVRSACPAHSNDPVSAMISNIDSAISDVKDMADITKTVCIDEAEKLRRENAALRDQVRQLRHTYEAPMLRRETPRVDITLDVSAGLSPRTLECLQESLLPMVRSVVLLHEGHDPEREFRVTCKATLTPPVRTKTWWPSTALHDGVDTP